MVNKAAADAARTLGLASKRRLAVNIFRPQCSWSADVRPRQSFGHHNDSPVDRGGTFFEPTVLTDVTTDMVITKEETFGPVAPLYRFKTEAEAIKMANDTEFGL